MQTAVKSDNLEKQYRKWEENQKQDSKNISENDRTIQKLSKRKKRLRTGIIVFIVLTVIMAVIKYFIYFREKFDYEPSAQSYDSLEIDTSSLMLMPFNEELTVANQQILIVNSNDGSSDMNFLSHKANQALVRAEIYADVDNLSGRPFRKFWTKLLYPEDDRLVRIGATGWIRPGEIMQKITLDEIPDKSCDATIRFVGVNPKNQKVSAGSFALETKIYVVDFNGKMLNEYGVWVDAE